MQSTCGGGKFGRIEGVEYAINTDFRAAIRVILAFEDDELTGVEKQAVMLQNMYPKMPENIQEAARLANKFLNGGEENTEDGERPMRLYSFAKDANYIFAVAMRPGNTTATFAVTEGKKVEVLGENRRIKVKKGKFSDDFSGYAVNLYKITK